MASNSMQGATPTRREQVKALGVAALGGMLEWFEFIIFVYLAAQISHNFFSPDMPEWVRLMQTFGIFAAGFLVRPIGGIVMAQMGDLLGRKRIFTLTLFLMAGPTLIVGLLPGYDQIGIWAPILLLVCRLLQGLSVGGEFPGAVCFVSEQVPGRKMPLALGILAASMALGALSGSVVVSVLTNFLGAEAMMEYGWRIPFIMGGIFGFISVYVRRFTKETPVFEQMKKQAVLSDKPPVRVLLEKHRFGLFAGMILSCALTLMATSMQQFPQTYFTMQVGLPLESISAIQSAFIFASMSGNILWGLIASVTRIPLLTAFIITQIGTISCLFWLYTQTSAESLLVPGICLGLFAGGAMSLPLCLLVQAFPAQQRYTGIATCYNVPVALFGGSSLLVLTFLAQYGGAAAAAYPAILAVFSVITGLVLWPRRHPVDPFKQGDSQDRAPMTRIAAKETAVTS